MVIALAKSNSTLMNWHRETWLVGVAGVRVVCFMPSLRYRGQSSMAVLIESHFSLFVFLSLQIIQFPFHKRFLLIPTSEEL